MMPKPWKVRWGGPGGGGELLRLAWPLVVSNSIWTLQIACDRVLLGRTGTDCIGAGMAAALLFWAPLSLLQHTVGYALNFVAQYAGARQPRRVGPVVWQALHVGAAAGLAFVALVPLARPLLALGGHPDELQELEAVYFRCLCFSALPALVTAAAGSFFIGRGDSRSVLLIDSAGLAVNVLLAYASIAGRWGFPALGVAGAGWATVLGSSTSAVLSLVLLLRRRHRREFNTAAGWRPEPALLRGLLRHGLPSGLLTCLEALAFTAFLFFVGWFGGTELAATGIAFTVNAVALLPALGIGQAVGVLVGRRLGERRPDLAARTTWGGLRLVLLGMGAAGVVCLLWPGPLVEVFRCEDDACRWEAVAAQAAVLLRYVAVYTVFEAAGLVLSHALSAAGDTRFLAGVAGGLIWPVLVAPTWAAWYFGWGLYWAWAFATLHVVVVFVVLLARFVGGTWRTLSLVEPSEVRTAGPAVRRGARGRRLTRGSV